MPRSRSPWRALLAALLVEFLHIGRESRAERLAVEEAIDWKRLVGLGVLPNIKRDARFGVFRENSGAAGRVRPGDPHATEEEPNSRLGQGQGAVSESLGADPRSSDLDMDIILSVPYGGNSEAKLGMFLPRANDVLAAEALAADSGKAAPEKTRGSFPTNSQKSSHRAEGPMAQKPKHSFGNDHDRRSRGFDPRKTNRIDMDMVLSIPDGGAIEEVPQEQEMAGDAKVLVAEQPDSAWRGASPQKTWKNFLPNLLKEHWFGEDYDLRSKGLHPHMRKDIDLDTILSVPEGGELEERQQEQEMVGEAKVLAAEPPFPGSDGTMPRKARENLLPNLMKSSHGNGEPDVREPKRWSSGGQGLKSKGMGSRQWSDLDMDMVLSVPEGGAIEEEHQQHEMSGAAKVLQPLPSAGGTIPQKTWEKLLPIMLKSSLVNERTRLDARKSSLALGQSVESEGLGERRWNSNLDTDVVLAMPHGGASMKRQPKEEMIADAGLSTRDADLSKRALDELGPSLLKRSFSTGVKRTQELIDNLRAGRLAQIESPASEKIGVLYYAVLGKDGSRQALLIRYLMNEKQRPNEIRSIKNCFRAMERVSPQGFLQVYALGRVPNSLSSTQGMGEALLLVEPFTVTLRQYLEQHHLPVKSRFQVVVEVLVNGVYSLFMNDVPHASDITMDTVLMTGTLNDDVNASGRFVLAPWLFHTSSGKAGLGRLKSALLSKFMPGCSMQSADLVKSDLRMCGHLLEDLLELPMSDNDRARDVRLLTYFATSMRGGYYDEVGADRLWKRISATRELFSHLVSVFQAQHDEDVKPR